MKRIRVAKKSAIIKKYFYKNQQKSYEYHIFLKNIKLLINGFKYLPHKYQNKSFFGELYFWQKKSFFLFLKKVGIFSILGMIRTRTHIKMKRIRNTDYSF